MARTKRADRWIGFAIGFVLLAGAVYALFFWQSPAELPEEPVVRPLKTIVIGAKYMTPPRKYPGKVRAGQEVDLAFEVPGSLIEKLIKRGDKVTRGQLLTRLDPRDYQNDLDAAKAEQDRAKAHLDRISIAVRTGAVSQQELSDAQATFDVAVAKVKIAAKALEDTYLRAKFAGVIANTFVENFQNVRAKEPILSLHDISSVEVEINVPEEQVALSAKYKGKIGYKAAFDYLPGRQFDLALKEFSTQADPKTQTFMGRLTMLAPDDVTIWPGMTVTVTPYLKVPTETEGDGHLVPVYAVPIDGLGTYYVWKVTGADDKGVSTVRRVNVEVGELIADKVFVLTGLRQGDRIAAAGVHFLQEGQQVRVRDAVAEAPAK